ncbi:hypothetical protein ACXZ1K_17365 [Pedobacter sp. PWIIR3]
MQHPINIVIKGMVISDLSGFRYGQQLHDQQFFELKFRQPLLGSPFSFATDDPANYEHQPITLQFESAFGKIRSVSGTIVKLEFSNTARQNAEVIVTGTMYKPEGNLSKFTIALFALLVLPILFTGVLFWKVSQLSSALTKRTGTVASFQDHTGKGTHHYYFKISPFHASFNRSYHAPVLNTARDNINALEGGTGQKVDFYVFKNELSKLNDPREKLNFFYLKSATQTADKFDYYYDILGYTTDKVGYYLAWIAYLLIEIFCYASALYCYKMYALYQQMKNKICWYTCLGLAVLFNIFILALML